MLRDYFNVRMIDGAVNDIRLIGTVTIVLLLIIAIIGMDWVARVRKIFYYRDLFYLEQLVNDSVQICSKTVRG